MPKAIAVPIRRQIVRLRQEGKSYKEVAQQLGQSPHTVRHLWRKFQAKGEASLTPNYERCGPQGTRYEQRVWRSAVYLKRRHPSWGAGFIRVKLAQRWPKQKLPHVRTLQRWFRQAKVATAAPKPKRPRRERATEAHQCWQVDAVSHQKLADGSPACWLSATDEASGAVIASSAFPLENL